MSEKGIERPKDRNPDGSFIPPRKPTILEVYLVIVMTVLAIAFYLTLFPLKAHADIRVCQRSEFTHCLAGPDSFVSKQTNFTYTNLFGSTITEKVDRVVGCLSPKLEACSLSALRNDADNLPTANLAAQHVDMVKSLQQRGQAEVLSCYRTYEAMQKLLNERCLVLDERCSAAALTIKNLTGYWVEYLAESSTKWWLTKPADREDYVFHFKTGVDGLERILAHREFCRNTLLPEITSRVKKKYKIK